MRVEFLDDDGRVLGNVELDDRDLLTEYWEKLRRYLRGDLGDQLPGYPRRLRVYTETDVHEIDGAVMAGLFTMNPRWAVAELAKLVDPEQARAIFEPDPLPEELQRRLDDL